MNISLAPSSKKKGKGKKPLGYGLNSRSDDGKKKPGGNVFGGSDDDDDGEGSNSDDDDGLSNRDRVNRQIAKEQAALRKRAQAAVAAVGDPSIYDYDGAYDSFQPVETKEQAAKKEEDRKSKYIGDLLQAAKKREQEREAVFERKVAREQAEEDAKEEFVGKEKFVTKAYKRKLEERQRWEAEEAKKEKEEELNDVTKKTGGAAMASFYGNFNRNVAMGQGENDQKGDASENDEKEGKAKPSAKYDDDDDFDPRTGGMSFMSGFERVEEPSGSMEHPANKETENSGNIEEKQAAQTLSIRETREKKVAEARIRYLARKKLALQ